MSINLLVQIFGWTGSILYLISYALVSLKKTEGDSVLYQGMNIIAGIMVVIYTLSLKAYATTGLNVVWALIGVYTLGRKWFTRS
jgi:phosphatidylserine synthase